uniref:Uncharacterized protein n=1 Tax=Aegilops tauschii subsp. strangulata TaxID=200361 RepID=A0A453S795_AEGTS
NHGLALIQKFCFNWHSYHTTINSALQTIKIQRIRDYNLHMQTLKTCSSETARKPSSGRTDGSPDGPSARSPRSYTRASP